MKRLLFLIVLVLLSAACQEGSTLTLSDKDTAASDGDKDHNWECESHADCALKTTNRVCDDESHACVEKGQCQSSSECESWFGYYLSCNENGMCVPGESDSDVVCVFHYDCLAGFSCKNSVCISDPLASICTNDSVCQSGYWCYSQSENEQGHCGPAHDNSSCNDHVSCPVGASCSNYHRCVIDGNAVSCTNDFDCPENYECQSITNTQGSSGKCVPKNSGGDEDLDQVIDGDLDQEWDSDQISCTANEDCPNDNFCFKQDHCVWLYPNCTTNFDCWPNQTCNQTQKRCEGSPHIRYCDASNLCPSGSICYYELCYSEHPYCTNVQDCWRGQFCDSKSGLCVDTIDGDKDSDIDIVDEDEAEEDNDSDPDKDIPTVSCQRSADCPENTVCGPGSVCIPHCSLSGCTYGDCNADNGFCEFCDSPCSESQCCKYEEDFWYCGSCCVPPCPEGQVCQGNGTCVTPACPESCAPNFTCGPETGFICSPIPTDGDAATTSAGVKCLMPNSECIDGVDTCCSGVCLYGYCL